MEHPQNQEKLREELQRNFLLQKGFLYFQRALSQLQHCCMSGYLSALQEFEALPFLHPGWSVASYSRLAKVLPCPMEAGLAVLNDSVVCLMLSEWWMKCHLYVVHSYIHIYSFWICLKVWEWSVGLSCACNSLQWFSQYFELRNSSPGPFWCQRCICMKMSWGKSSHSWTGSPHGWVSTGANKREKMGKVGPRCYAFRWG